MRPAGTSSVTPASACVAVVLAHVLQADDGRALRHGWTGLARLAGQGCWASSRTQATPGRPVLTCSRCLASSARSMRALTRNMSFWRSLAVSTVLGVNCAVLATS